MLYPTTKPQELDGYPPLLSVKHLHQMTGLSVQTIRKLMNDGSLPSCRIGRRMYCPRSAFEAYINGAQK